MNQIYCMCLIWIVIHINHKKFLEAIQEMLTFTKYLVILCIFFAYAVVVLSLCFLSSCFLKIYIET